MSSEGRCQPTVNDPSHRNAFGSMIFCDECGNLLDALGDMSSVVCNACGKSAVATEFEDAVVVTRTNPNAFPSKLKENRSLVKVVLGTGKAALSKIEQDCPECDSKEMEYYTMQLRSADEGATVFYKCPKCGYNYSQNN